MYLKGKTMLEYPQHKELCAHNLTTPTIFQDEGDKYSRASWTLASKCTKCGDVFIYYTRFGLYNDSQISV